MQDNNFQTLINMYCTKEQTPVIHVLENQTVREVFKNEKIKWTYDIVSDTSIFEDRRAIVVRLYYPGGTSIGRYVYTENEAHNAHNLALEEAFEQIPTIVRTEVKKTTKEPEKVSEMYTEKVTETNTTNKKENVQNTSPVQQQASAVPLTQEQILDMIMQQQETEKTEPSPITTMEQYQKDTREEIPFEEVQLSEDELDKMLTGNIQTSNQQVQPVEQQFPMNPPVAQNQQQNTPVHNSGFTQEQIMKMNEFKKKFNIKNDEEFNKYINAWNKKCTNKRDITPANIESFLKYVDDLGKFPG